VATQIGKYDDYSNFIGLIIGKCSYFDADPATIKLIDLPGKVKDKIGHTYFFSGCPFHILYRDESAYRLYLVILVIEPVQLYFWKEMPGTGPQMILLTGPYLSFKYQGNIIAEEWGGVVR
jgi:hypothetical protein